MSKLFSTARAGRLCLSLAARTQAAGLLEMGLADSGAALKLFSKKNNIGWIRAGAANSPLGIHLDIDFELIRTEIKPSDDWFKLHPEEREKLNLNRLVQESKIYDNLIEQYTFTLKAIKQT